MNTNGALPAREPVGQELEIAGRIVIEQAKNGQVRRAMTGALNIPEMINQLELLKLELLQYQMNQQIQQRLKEAAQSVQVATEVPPIIPHK